MVPVPLEGCGDPVVLDSCGEAARQRAQGPAGASAAAGCGSSIVLSDAAALAVAALTSGSLRPRSAQRESRRTGRRSVSAGHGRECRGREGMPTAQTHPARPSSSRKFENCCQSAPHRTRSTRVHLSRIVRARHVGGVGWEYCPRTGTRARTQKRDDPAPLDDARPPADETIKLQVSEHTGVPLARRGARAACAAALPQ